MKKRKYAVNESIERMCSACDVEQNHTVATVTKLGQITELVCQVCGMSSTFKNGIKTAIGVMAKAGSAYDRTRKYRKGQSILHATFGQGEVLEIIEPGKMDVLFGDRTRRLIHAQI